MRRSPDRREFCCDDDDWATWHPSSLRWARMQRLIGGVGQGEAKDSFLRVVWNPGEGMVSSGGIAAAPTAPAAGAWCGFCFQSVSLRERIEAETSSSFLDRARRKCEHGHLTYVTVLQAGKCKTGGMTCKHHFGGRGAAQPLLVPCRWTPGGAVLPSLSFLPAESPSILFPACCMAIC